MMNEDPVIWLSGSAFQDNEINNRRPISFLRQEKDPERDVTNFVSLTEWCNKNFISKRIGRALIKKKLLVGQRLWGQWWVCANLDCLPVLLEYLGIEELYFDASNPIAK